MNALRSTVGHLQPSSQGKTPHPHINRVEQLEEDPYWFNNYSSFVSDLDRPSTAPPATGLAEVLPPPHRSAKRFEIKPRRLTPFPQTPQFRTEDLHSKITTTTPITPKTNTSDSGNDQIISIYPTEILSPTLSDPSERSGDGESPLKAVRFAHINTYHSTASPRTASSPRTVNISPSNLYNLAEEPPHTASTHKRAQSDPKAGRGNLRGAGDQRRISDPIPPYFGLPSKDLPLRGDIPVKMSSRSAANGKRPERERKDGMRSRGYDRDGGREYGPSNIHRPIRPAPKDVSTLSFQHMAQTLPNLLQYTCAKEKCSGLRGFSASSKHQMLSAVPFCLPSGSGTIGLAGIGMRPGRAGRPKLGDEVLIRAHRGQTGLRPVSSSESRGSLDATSNKQNTQHRINSSSNHNFHA